MRYEDKFSEIRKAYELEKVLPVFDNYIRKRDNVLMMLGSIGLVSGMFGNEAISWAGTLVGSALAYGQKLHRDSVTQSLESQLFPSQDSTRRRQPGRLSSKVEGWIAGYIAPYAAVVTGRTLGNMLMQHENDSIDSLSLKIISSAAVMAVCLLPDGATRASIAAESDRRLEEFSNPS